MKVHLLTAKEVLTHETDEYMARTYVNGHGGAFPCYIEERYADDEEPDHPPFASLCAGYVEIENGTDELIRYWVYSDGYESCATISNYNRTWRVWEGKPSEKQRAETAWNPLQKGGEELMGYSRYKWLVISDDGSTKIIEAETIDEVVYEISEEQPRAIIKTDYR